ncbi:hypothetical protein [Halorubrum distributum]|uniref:hypothetical protein n=2 Tax=Halorubrum TaxID=56688 RepID=UPI0012691ED7|nr:hypothetical protein [Halorubrum arcis]
MVEENPNESGSGIVDIDRRSSLKAVGGALGLIAGGSLSIGSVAGESEPEPDISVRDATNVAQQTVEKASQKELYREFAGATIEKPKLYYSLTKKGADSDVVASVYVFPVVDGNTHVGHVTTGAHQEMPPVVEYGTDPAPHLETEQVVSHDGLSPSSETQHLFQGPLSFGIKANSERADEEYFVNLMTGGAQKLENAPKINPTTDHTQRWDKLTDPDEADLSDVEPLNSGSVSDVPNWTDTGYSEWPGCTPIAASMCIGYHETNPNRTDIIDGLNDEMNTNPNGRTWPQYMPSGIEGYDSSYSASNNYTGRPAAAKGGVDDNNPPFVNTLGDKEAGKKDVAPDGIQPPEWDVLVGHSETVVGYEEEGSWTGTDLYLDTHNTWGSTRTVLVGDYWDTYMITTVEP